MGTIDEYLQEIAKKHGVILQKNEPILFLYSFLAHFQKDLDKYQQQNQQILVSQLEELLSRWDDTVTQKANRVMNNSFNVAKKNSEEQYQVKTNEFTSILQKLCLEQQESVHKQLRTVFCFAVVNMICAGVLGIAAMFIFLSH